MANTDSLSNFILKRRLTMVSTEKSAHANFVSAYAPPENPFDKSLIMVKYRGRVSREDKRCLQKALNAGLQSCKLGEHGTFLFFGLSDYGVVFELFRAGYAYSNDLVIYAGSKFEEKLLRSVIKIQTVVRVIMIDKLRITSFALQSDSLKTPKTVEYRSDRTILSDSDRLKAFKDELLSIEEACRSKLILGINSSMMWIVKDVAKLLKTFKQVKVCQVSDALEDQIQGLLLSSGDALAEYEIVEEMRSMREVFSAPAHQATFGVDASLQALQEHMLSLVLVHKTLQAEVSVNRESGWATVRDEIQEEPDLQADRVELFQWLQDDALRYRCKIIVVQSNLPQGERLVQEGGMAGLFRPGFR